MVSMSALFLATAFLAVGAFAETDLELAVESIIDGFRTIMPTGSERSGLPPLDPATIRQLSLNIKLSPFNAQCVASDIKISGTSAFEVTKLSQIDGSNKIAVDLELPNIDINGQYDLKGKVKIGFINVKLNGKGDLRAKLNGLKASATVDLLVGADGSLKVNQIALNSWSYKDLSIKLDKIAGGGVIGNTVNSLINSLAPTFIKSNKDKINALVVSKAKVLMNKYLASLYEKKLMHQPEGAAHSSPISLTIDEEAWNVSEETQEILDLLAAAAVGIPKLNAASLPEM